MRLLLVALVLVPLSASGQEAASGTGQIVGMVVDRETGEPLIGASVLLVEAYRGVMADIEGRFQIRDVPAGDYTVRVSSNAYGSTETTLRVEPGKATTFLPALESHEVIGEFEVQGSSCGIPPPRVISGETSLAASGTGRIVGVVTDAEYNEPLWGAHVQVDGIDIKATSKGDGVFVLDSVPVGEHVIRVSYVGFDAEEVGEIKVQADENTTIRIALRSASFCECVYVLAEPDLPRQWAYRARIVEHVGTEIVCCSAVRVRRDPPVMYQTAR